MSPSLTSLTKYKERRNFILLFSLFILLLTCLVAGVWWHYQPDRMFEIILAMLIASCPCAFSLAAPAAATSASHYLRRFGVLLSNFDVLQELGKITHWCFDKKGTLTKGNLIIEKLVVLGKGVDSEQQALEIAAALERDSQHVIAASFSQVSSELEASDICNYDQGITGKIANKTYYLGKAAWVYKKANISQAQQDQVSECDKGGTTLVVLACEQQLLAAIMLSDQLRAHSKQTLSFLAQSNKQCWVLSGDRQSVVNKQFGDFDLRQAKGDLLPQDKLAELKNLQSQNAKVAMVGDGVNDAPVLSQADVSIALASGSQLSHSQADIILLGGRLDGIELLHKVVAKAQGIIKQNIFWAIAYNVLALPLAATGYLTPWMAAIGMSLSSLLVVLNARRIS